MRALVIAACLLLPAAAQAGAIGSACAKSARGGANGALCGCIQQVADMTLSRADQRRAAKFFADPHEAQETRTSARRSDSDFWLRYKRFGETAAQLCPAG